MATRNTILQFGKTYRNKNGSSFVCMSPQPDKWSCKLQNVNTGWTFYAHIITMYEDGTIEWDYSSDGKFEKTV